MENRVFFPQVALDQWIAEGSVDLQQGELTILAESRRYELVDAVRVVRELSGSTDTHELVGRAKARAFLEQMGAEIVESSMLIGDAAYDVDLGWLGAPIGTFEEHLNSAAHKNARAGRSTEDATSDEELLRRFLANHL